MVFKRLGYMILTGVLAIGIISGCEYKGSNDNEAGSINKPQVTGDKNKSVASKEYISKNVTGNMGKYSENNTVLKGRIICIDPGHQAKGNREKEPIAPGSSTEKDKTTSGTAGIATRIPEYKLNLDMAILIKKKLELLGAKVIMTRQSHNVDLSNIDRAEIANRNNSELTVRIHADGAVDNKVRGASVLYPGNRYNKDSKLLEQSRNAAEIICRQIGSVKGVVSAKAVERNDLTGFNWSKVPVVLIELGFMSNPEEDKLMQTEEFRENMADAIVRGIIEYFE